MSDDGTRGLTIIAFVGSVFSPYYAHARHRNGRRAVPLDHCAFNVALYGARDARWSMTERGHRHVTRTPTRLAIGPSEMRWDGDTLTLRLDEVAAPLPFRIRGSIEVRPDAFASHRVLLDRAGRHRWSVIAPSARIRVTLDAPALSWSGSAYLDSNRGDVPLEQDFVRWDWSRAHLADGRTAVVYDIERRGDASLHLAECFTPDGRVEPFDAPAIATLPRSRWGLARTTRAAPGTTPVVASSLEDGPFYARSLVSTRWLGEAVTSVHEHVSLDRFARRWVRALLPFRMPRRFP